MSEEGTQSNKHKKHRRTKHGKTKQPTSTYHCGSYFQSTARPCHHGWAPIGAHTPRKNYAEDKSSDRVDLLFVSEPTHRKIPLLCCSRLLACVRGIHTTQPRVQRDGLLEKIGFSPLRLQCQAGKHCHDSRMTTDKWECSRQLGMQIQLSHASTEMACLKKSVVPLF